MLSFISSSIATLVALLTLLIFTPALAGHVISIAFRGFGYLIRRKTKGRRELIRARVRVEEEDYRSSRRRREAGSSTAPKTEEEEEDWEKVEEYSGETSGNSSDSNGDATGHGDWAGIVGFFHPFCNAGGGGERVLWAAIDAVQKRWPKAICVVYTGDHDVDKATMLHNIKRRFNIQLYPPTVVLMYLRTRKYVVSSTYSRFTLIAQSLGSLILANEAFNLVVPDIFIDTMGYAFTLALSRYLFPTVPTGAYVHYPTISTDMLESLSDASGSKGLNAGAGKGWKGAAKLYYWHAFAKLYGWVGSSIDVVMCNSSWTASHIASLWLPSRQKSRDPNAFPLPTVIFPPVAVSELEDAIKIDVQSEKEIRQPTILYIAQFRPEKNHTLVLHAFSRFLKQYTARNVTLPAELQPSLPPKLVLIGSVRHHSPDETHIYNLRLQTHELRIRDHTVFLCDATWPTMLSNLRQASIGVNAMWNEHFGIGVVEYQAAGLISIVHDSGGPKQDIVVDLGDGATGFRATTEVEYAAAFEAALALPEEEKVAMRMRARTSAKRFSSEEFEKKWLIEMEKLIGLQVRRAGGGLK
ncbi:asparagine-linked glycosylation protein [Myotisia sp. PD_48]|nr:asparagine-linked glycosylation protein [Myotisia sp. PD_48]